MTNADHIFLGFNYLDRISICKYIGFLWSFVYLLRLRERVERQAEQSSTLQKAREENVWKQQKKLFRRQACGRDVGPGGRGRRGGGGDTGQRRGGAGVVELYVGFLFFHLGREESVVLNVLSGCEEQD